MAEIQDLNPVDASNTGRWPENMSPPQINDAGRADEGILARWYQDMDGSRTSSGSSNAFAVTSSRTISALFDNLALVFTANHSITGAATLNLNGLGAKSIRKLNSMNVQTGDIVSGQPVYVIYKQSIDQWLMMSSPAAVATPVIQVTEQGTTPSTPASGEGLFYGDNAGFPRYLNDSGHTLYLSPPLLHVRDQRTANTSGDSITAGAWRTRVLQTVITNQIPDSSLGSNRIVLPAGDYLVDGWATLAVGAGGNFTANHKVRLRNITDSSDALIGSSETIGSSASTTGTSSIIRGKVTIADQKTFELQHRSSLNGTGGLAANFGVVEVHAEILIWKLR